MGLFSFFSGVVSGVVGGIASGIRAVAGGICSAVSGLTSALSSFASKAISPFISALAGKAAGLLGAVAGIISGPLGPIIGPIIVDLVIKLIVKAVSSLAEENEVVEKGERPEDVGYRMEESERHEDWKKREEFDSFKEYYAYLKEQIPEETIDRKQVEGRKDFYSLLGMQAELKGLEEKLNIYIPTSVLVEIGRSAMQIKEVNAFVRAFSQLGYKELNISDYLHGKLPPGELERITAALLDALKYYFPEKSDDILVERLSEIRRASGDDLELVSVYRDTLKEQYGDEIAKLRQAKEIPDAVEKTFEAAGFAKDGLAPEGEA